MARGFTIVELVLTVTIMAVVIAAAAPAYRNFIVKYQLDSSARDVQGMLRTAESLSMASREDSAYGVHYTTGAGATFTLFKGSTYAGRDVAYDELEVVLPDTITLSSTVAGSEVVFTKREGSTINTGVLTFTSRELGTRDITINRVGMIDVD